MKVKELIDVLSGVDQEADIIMAVHNHYQESDTKSHGRAQIDVATAGDENEIIVVLNPGNCGWDQQVKKLNIKNWRHIANIRH